MSWGHATSKDLLTWNHQTITKPALAPDMSYDKEGVFTGCFTPSGPLGEKGQMTLFYTSVCHLPLHWSIPYVRGCEGLSAAVSRDGGKTWDKVDSNPILPDEPKGINVTGWRDPYFAPWKALDTLRGKKEQSLYGAIAGGIHDDGPAIFLYAAPPNDLLKWEYLGIFLKVPGQLRHSPKWSADLGVNWECSNFMTLPDLETKTTAKDFIVCGSEGGKERPWVTSYREAHPKVPVRTVNYCFWLCGATVKGEDDSVSFRIDYSGFMDHGCFYAASTFQDPVSDRRIVWGWIKEEDLPIEYSKRKGWTGCLSLPRELFLQRIPRVVKALQSSLTEITSITAVENAPEEGVYDVETLGIRPLTDLTALRQGSPLVLNGISLPKSSGTTHSTSVSAARWELEATIDVLQGCTSVGLHIRHTADMSSITTISFSPAEEEITVDRTKSSRSADVNRSTERGPMTLFSTKSGHDIVQEQLKLHVFSDGNTIEIFANDRFAMATVIYTTDPTALDLTLFAEGSEDSALFRDVSVWADLKPVLGSQKD